MALPQDLPVSFLRYFVLIAETRSFSETALKAHRSQPAVSLAIKQLENLLGQSLFEPADRTQLTPFGQACLPLAKQFLEAQARTVQALQKLASPETGRARLACVPTAATHFMPGVLERFSRTHPNASVTQLDDTSINIERMVLAQDVDFGICGHVSDNAELAFEPLFQDSYGLVCSVDHPVARLGQATWDEAAQMPLIGSAASAQLALEYPRLPALAEPHFHVSNMTSLLSTLDRGVGAAILALQAIPPCYAGRLAFVPLQAPVLTRTIGVLRLKKRSLPPPAAILLDTIRWYLEEHPMRHQDADAG
ncbi:LysR family transcriptional regulator [Pigmentiphaga soli]|uniref:LysR family transcriptional regulator n=1 Tax=Pigmentiphaga soli TaxID=1007095 RepID=A0ABP8HD89_9BURK